MAKEIYHPLLDPDYQDIYVDIDEIRTRKAPDGQELNYRYIHGGFAKKAVKFSLHFPKHDQFKGRFFHYLSPFPGPDEEMASIPKTGGDDVIAFSLLNGAYFVESNMGSKAMFGPNGDDKDRWKSSAAVAEFSRKKAMEIYKCERPVGIVFGGSGGGYKTMACIENTDAWDGAVPYVIGSPVSLPNTITMHVQGERVLRNAFPKILEALDAGGGFLTIGMCYGMDDLPGVLSKVRPGDELTLDNSDYIAIQSYYRHQVPADLSFHAWDQFRKEDGSPAIPQRDFVMGYGFTGTGTVQDGDVQGKVIVIQCLMDESTCPWCGDWYRGKVREAKGTEENFRIYYMQRCMHGDVGALGNNMVVNYKGALLQALLDMAAWLQEGKEPLRSTVYERVGGQIVEEADPEKRNGMQAGVTLTVNGSK